MTYTQQTERNFPMHTLESAPEASKEAMQWYQENFGMVPNLAQILANSPALLLSYWQTQLNLLKHGALSKQEVNIVETVVAHENRCQYCVAGHTAFGKNPLFNNTDEQLGAVRSDIDFEEPKLNALRDFTLVVMKNQGRMADAKLQEFLDAGYTRTQALDVVACISAKVMSNYANQIALTPVDDAFASLADGLPYKEERQAIAV